HTTIVDLVHQRLIYRNATKMTIVDLVHRNLPVVQTGVGLSPLNDFIAGPVVILRDPWMPDKAQIKANYLITDPECMPSLPDAMLRAPAGLNFLRGERLESHQVRKAQQRAAAGAQQANFPARGPALITA